MNNNGWITDRLPTEEEAPYGRVLYSGSDRVYEIEAYLLAIGNPWMPFPDPYVKPKRWRVKWEQKGTTTLWTLCLYDQSVHTLYGNLPDEAAERIADIYNEVMP